MWIKDLNIRPDNINLLEENIGKKILDIGLGKDFLNMMPKVQTTKAKIGKWDYIKLKSFAQQIINKMKRQSTECEKNFANHILNNGLITLKRNLQNLTTTTSHWNNPIKKWAEELNRHFSKEDYQYDQQAHEKRLNITNHQGNVNQNHSEISPHTS